MPDHPTDDPTRVLLVGLGPQGRRHLRVAGPSRAGTVVATVDPHAEGVDGVEHHPSIEAAIEALGEDRRPQAAIVATPAGDHVASTSALLRAGIPVLVEKPIALTPEEGQVLVDLAAATGTLLFVGHVERFNPCVQLVAALLRGGTVGTPVACSFRRVGLPPMVRPTIDVVADLAVHDLDVFRMLVGGPVELGGASGWAAEDGLVESAHVLVASGRVHGMVEVNWRTPVRIRGFTVTTETCLVEVNYTTQTVEVVAASEVEDFEEFTAFQSHYGAAQRTRMEARAAEPLAEQFEAFVATVRGEPSPFLASAADGLGAVALATAASAEIHARTEAGVRS